MNFFLEKKNKEQTKNLLKQYVKQTENCRTESIIPSSLIWLSNTDLVIVRESDRRE